MLDLGCGPGHIGRYVAGRGVATGGLDLSPEMARIAHDLNPTIPITIADLRSLPVPDGHLGGITAFYSLIHLARAALPDVFAELRRVLREGAPLLIAVHAGAGGLHADEFLGQPVDLDATLYDRDELASLLEQRGFRIDAIDQRDPYPFEHPTDRLYALAAAGRSRAS